MSTNSYSHSAGHGNEHFYWQRVTALALAILVIWFAGFILYLAMHEHSGYAFLLQSIGRPFNGSMLVLFVITSSLHASLGMQVIVEDYISDKKIRLLLVMAQRIFCVFIATIGVVSTLKIMAATAPALLIAIH